MRRLCHGNGWVVPGTTVRMYSRRVRENWGQRVCEPLALARPVQEKKGRACFVPAVTVTLTDSCPRLSERTAETHVPKITGRTVDSAWGMKLCALFQQQLGQTNIGMLATVKFLMLRNCLRTCHRKRWLGFVSGYIAWKWCGSSPP